MRHRIHHRKLNRTSEHRKALRRNLAQSLIEHGQVTTTVPKAKDVRPFFERLVTLAVRAHKLNLADDVAGALRAKRCIHRLISDRAMIPVQHCDAYNDLSDAARAKTLRMASGRRYRRGEPKGKMAFTAESVTKRLVEDIAPKFEDRPGGYTRLIHLSEVRVGDSAPLAMLQLVGDETPPMSLTRPEQSARKRRANRRYAAVAKLAKSNKGERGRQAAVEEEGIQEPGSHEPTEEKVTGTKEE